MNVLLPEQAPTLAMRRTGMKIAFSYGTERYWRIYTSAEIARRVESGVTFWVSTLPNPALPRSTLGACIERAELEAVAAIYHQSRARSGSCFYKLPKHFDSL